MNSRLPLFLIVCSTLILSACSTRKPATAIIGTVAYSAPLEFSGSAQLQLLLTDVSAEGGAPEVATVTTNVKQLPFQYSLPYEPSNIQQTHRYTISARIYVDKSVKYATDTAIEVLTQGRGSHADFVVIATGTNETGTTAALTAGEIFQGEIRNDKDISLYRAGLADGHINWLEEDRSNGSPTPAHNRYEFKGALLVHYIDSTPMEILFDETGKPKSITRNGKILVLTQEMAAVNAARNRASLLRSHALARRESQLHRKATKNDG